MFILYNSSLLKIINSWYFLQSSEIVEEEKERLMKKKLDLKIIGLKRKS